VSISTLHVHALDKERDLIRLATYAVGCPFCGVWATRPCVYHDKTLIALKAGDPEDWLRSKTKHLGYPMQGFHKERTRYAFASGMYHRFCEAIKEAQQLRVDSIVNAEHARDDLRREQYDLRDWLRSNYASTFGVLT
jgi:hypothetical protein